MMMKMGDEHPKRKMKTPSQLEILERVYAEDKYPSELVRSELSAQLSLTDRQVKMWFCHRRLKDRKVNNEEQQQQPPPPQPPPPQHHHQNHHHPSKKHKMQQQQQQLDQQQHFLHHPPPQHHHPHPGLSLEIAGMQPPSSSMRQHNFLEMMHPEERAFHMRQLAAAKRAAAAAAAAAVCEIDNGGGGRRMQGMMLHNVSPLDCRLSVNAEVAAIRLVEEQLGEPLREDGPILGYEFDPLPPGAFDTPIEHGSSGSQWRNGGRDQFSTPEGFYSDSKLHSRHESKFSRVLAASSADFSPSPATSSSKRKNSAAAAAASPFLPSIPIAQVPHSPRIPQEHQFIPEHPQFYERNSCTTSTPTTTPATTPTTPNPNPNATPSPKCLELAPPAARISPLSSFLPGGEAYNGAALAAAAAANGFCHESRAPPSLGLGFFPPGGDFLHRAGSGPFPPPPPAPEVQLLPPVRPPMSEKAIAGSERLIMLHEQEQARIERKRKAEEARVAKEMEAQEKRMRKEVERQEAMRRKKEDQERKEQERINREKQKELERLMRERAREEERLQRQHRKEYERMERLMQKEHQRQEKLRQKEEMRREKEATKLRAAYERATAKKLAKLSTGLIDDEQLELMQMGAFVQGLASASGFDPIKVELPKFPPASVRMKPAIAVPPWIDSDHNVANLFMVWRMLTNFADVIGLWPFTLDEFVQSLHDYDSRLLGEIHIALLKTLVKDVKDASQAATIGTNQALTITSGGHPELVEAAYAWGFDIQEWGQHLNGLTWPEILRQFALASGYGPRWKKKVAEPAPTTTFNISEGKNAEDAVANIRSGAAAANAVTQMRGKTSSRIRKQQQQQQQQQKLVLTPGTVKYAAFQVLSVEGSKGLTILEVVDRVQKAGLRDLSTSKTPEASISAVLSRDSKLFERVAPSTYCVRAIYRKNPEDAEAILQAAREKIRMYESRLSDAEAVEEDIEEIEEREEEEEDGEEQDAEEAEAAGAGTNSNHPNNTTTSASTNNGEAQACPSSTGKVILRFKVGKQQVSEASSAAQKSSSCEVAPKGGDPAGSIDINTAEAPGNEENSSTSNNNNNNENNENNNSSDGMEIDESQVGEVWVQGLMEGEYTELSVEERLSGLVALVEAVNQGNTVRCAIEERYEAASALKRQLWEEVQLDKRRLKEECSAAAAKSADEGPVDQEKALFPVLALDNSGAQEQEQQQQQQQVQDDPNCSEDANLAAERKGCIQPTSDKSRAEMKADIRLRAERLYVIRSLPLGSDRRHNRYWQFVTCNSGQDPGCGRIYFESHSDGHWEVIDTEEALNALMNSLDTRGTREAHLFMALKEAEASLRNAMESRSKQHQHQQEQQPQQEQQRCLQQCNGSDSCEGSPSSAVVNVRDSGETAGSIVVELGRSASEKNAAVERYKDLERWLWKQQWCCRLKAVEVGEKRSSSDGITECESCHDLHWPHQKHCPYCHSTDDHFCSDDGSVYAQHVQECERKMVSKDPGWKLQGGMLPPKLQLLKKLLFMVEISIPFDAFKPIWSCSYREAWCNRLKAAASAAEVLQAFMDLESSINEDWISASYETIEQLGSLIGSQKRNPPWIPQTTAAVALRLMVFDGAVAYNSDQRQQLLENRDKQQHHKVSGRKDGKGAAAAGFEEEEDEDEEEEEEEAQDQLQTGATTTQFFKDDEGWNKEAGVQGGGDCGAGVAGAGVGGAESDDSSQLNWDAQDSFEDPQQQNGRRDLEGMMLLDQEEDDEEIEEEDDDEEELDEDSEDEEDHRLSSDTDDEIENGNGNPPDRAAAAAAAGSGGEIDRSAGEIDPAAAAAAAPGIPLGTGAAPANQEISDEEDED